MTHEVRAGRWARRSTPSVRSSTVVIAVGSCRSQMCRERTRCPAPASKGWACLFSRFEVYSAAATSQSPAPQVTRRSRSAAPRRKAG
jgi:hypothetical protein